MGNWPWPAAGPPYDGDSLRRAGSTFDDDRDGDTFVRVTVTGTNELEALTSGFFGLFPVKTTKGPFRTTVRSAVTWESLTDSHVGISIVPNGNDTRATAARGALWCGDDNTFGELGDGTTTARTVSTPVAHR